MNYQIREVSYKEAMEMVVKYHYLHRKSQMYKAFGLYDIDRLIGVCIFGTPASRGLQTSICGKEYADEVIELNRLFIFDETPKNTESWFVSRCMKLLDKKIIVSFADPNNSHNGTIYQALNFMYTGKSSNTTALVDSFGNEFHFRKLGHIRKAMKEEDIPQDFKVKVRSNHDSIDKHEIVAYLKKYKSEKGLTITKIDTLMNYRHAAGHWFRVDDGHSFPSVDDWLRLKNVLGFDDTYDELMTQYIYTYDREQHIKALGLSKISRKGKHRYIYLNCKGFKRKELLKNMKHSPREYPKV